MAPRAGRITLIAMAAVLAIAAFFPAYAAIPASPVPPRLFNDFAGMLDAAAAERIEAQLLMAEKETSAQIAVVTVDDMDGDYIEHFAVELFESWGIGRQGEDDGLLLLIAEEERDVRIEVGYGLEGEINDSKAGRILDDYFVPAMQSGNTEKAIEDTIAALRAEITGVPLAEEVLSTTAQVILLVIAVIIIILVIGFLKFISKNMPTGGTGTKPPFSGFGGPWSSGPKNFGGFGGFGGGGGKSGGGFGGFGGGRSGGGGAGRGW
jgi:uncharacterized protein